MVVVPSVSGIICPLIPSADSLSAESHFRRRTLCLTTRRPTLIEQETREARLRPHALRDCGQPQLKVQIKREDFGARLAPKSSLIFPFVRLS
jgi:hypothetical protein